MKILDTSPITSAVGFPPKSGTWNFLQLAYQECVESIIRNLIGSGYSTSAGYILWGMLPSPPSSLTAGAIFYNGKIYLYPGGLVPVNLFPDVTLVNISQSQYTTNADPVLFTDSNNYNVHNIFSISLSSGTSGTGGICNFSALIRLESYAMLRGAITTLQFDTSTLIDALQVEIDALQVEIDALQAQNTFGAWTNITMSAGWTAGGNPPQYRTDGMGRVYLRGQATLSSGSGAITTTLPTIARPTQQMYLPCYTNVSGTLTVNVVVISAGNIFSNLLTVGEIISLDGITYLNS